MFEVEAVTPGSCAYDAPTVVRVKGLYCDFGCPMNVDVWRVGKATFRAEAKCAMLAAWEHTGGGARHAGSRRWDVERFTRATEEERGRMVKTEQGKRRRIQARHGKPAKAGVPRTAEEAHLAEVVFPAIEAWANLLTEGGAAFTVKRAVDGHMLIRMCGLTCSAGCERDIEVDVKPEGGGRTYVARATCAHGEEQRWDLSALFA